MKITWIGHSCFKIENNGYTIITDPYEDGYVPGLKPLRESADMVLCSHQHGDHNAAGRVKLTGRKPAFRLTLLDSYHDPDKGAKRGPNQIALVEYEGFRAVHLGDQGCALNRDQIDTLRKADLLMIPVGGFFTIGPDEAADMCEQLQPRVIVPMHYRRRKMGFDVLTTLDAFTGKFPGRSELPGNVLEIGPKTSGLYVLNL